MRRRPRWHDAGYRALIVLGLGFFGLIGTRIRSRGEQHLPESGGAVLAITHFGYLDFALTERVVWGRTRRLVRFLATDAAFRNPVAGPLLRMMEHIPVDRHNGRQVYVEALRRLRAGELVGVFPEAQVDRSFTVHGLHSGAVRMAATARVPLIPVVVWGGHRLITRGRRPSLRDGFHTPVSVHVGPPIAVTRETADAQSAALRTRLTEMLAEAQRDYPVSARRGADWWLPAALGGSAPTPAQAAALDEADARRRHRGRAPRAHQSADNNGRAVRPGARGTP